MELSGRRSGVQLHVTSLRSGRLDADAYAFVDWLAAAGQSYWQVLPLNPPDRWGSPYKSRSAFACSPRLLGEPDAAVSAGEEQDFGEREAFWIGDWARAGGGRRAVRDQVRFEREWLALRRHARDRGVAIVGDLPLYVARDSVDHRSHPALFHPQLLAGAPPDDFAPRGQLWGNPVYDWPAMRRRRYRWWVERLRRSARLFDLVRLDHFRGLVAYWAVPAGSRDARGGRWLRGPGAAPLLTARAELGELPLIAEDLGVITPPVERLRQRLGVPGMAVLQFLYEPDEDGARGGRSKGAGAGAGAEDPLESGSRGRVLYTATHDQTTLAGWWSSLDAAARAPLQRALDARKIRRADPAWSLIDLAQSSPAPLVVMQAQDLLGLPDSARMNTPGRASGNWSWQLPAGALTAPLARRLREATRRAERLP
jgi:4-alpha-glucanotransferase